MNAILFYIISTLIIFACLFFLWKNRREFFNLRATFNIFYLLFFGIVPVFQFRVNVSFFGGRTLLTQEYTTVSAIFLIIVVLYNLFYNYFKKTFKTIGINKHKSEDFSTTVGKLPNLILAIVVLCFIIKLIYLYTGYVNFFVRGFFLPLENKIIAGFLNQLYILICILPITVLLYVLSGKMSVKNKYLFIFLVIAAFINAFPISMSRVNVATLYLPIVVILARKYFSVKYFSFFLIGSFLFIFPLLNKFREYQFTHKINPFEGFFQFDQAHYDNFYNFALTYFDVPITYGKQLLGALLFFVPRTVWHNKPIGSGNYMANLEGFSFGNVSQNFFAEGYINFGLLGILFFLILYALLSCYIDKLGKIYWERKSWGMVIYLQLIFFSFFLMRGDLISSIALLINYVIVNLIIYVAWKYTTPNKQQS